MSRLKLKAEGSYREAAAVAGEQDQVLGMGIGRKEKESKEK